MAQHEPVDPLLEFDALLTKELSVTPSPEFLPRVRERIRLEPDRSRWSLFAVRWSLGVPLAAAAIIVLGVGLSVLSETRPQAPTPPAFSVASAHPHPRIPEYPVPNTESRLPKPEYRVPNPEYRTPEVIVDQRQRAALVSMLRLINQGQLTEDSFKTTTPVPAEIGVEPVAVSPIVVGGVLPSETERK